ncbi:MAG: DUF6179 domain-containing protein [Oscillospiraceae bacterium]
MGEAIDTLHPIDEKRLDPRHYAESLIGQALSCKLLSDKDFSRIQADLLSILAEQCDKWCGGESSSVPTEKAEDMLTSILFVISVKLKTCRSPEQAVELIKSEGMGAVFESGIQTVRRKVTFARILHNHISGNLFETPNVFYRPTVVDGIGGFFKLYRPQFSAHEIHITADYPVFAGRPQADGIEFIEQYLRCIEAENAFCVQFRPQDIHRLLCGLTEDYGNIPMNLFEYVTLSALGLALVDRDPRKLDLSEKDIDRLYSVFCDSSDGEILSCLKNAADSLDRRGLLPKSTKQYLSVTLQRYVFTINSAVRTGTLSRVFLVPLI